MNDQELLPEYPGLKYAAAHLSSFLFTPYDGIFLLSLKEGGTDRFKPDYPEKFLEWLNCHKIRDVFGKTIIVKTSADNI
jgi:hypothetical protein